MGARVVTRRPAVLDAERHALMLTANRDPRIRGLAFAAYVEALHLLDCEEPRLLKTRWVAHVLGARREHVSRALRRLLETGYMQRTRGRNNRPYLYLLVARPPVARTLIAPRGGAAA